MSDILDFYFDYSSPYGYFASTRIEALAHRAGRQVHWHPILLGPLFKLMGSAPLTEIPLKGAYARRDFARTAELHDIAYTQPEPFPIGTVSAARLTLYVRQHHPETLATLVKTMYAAFFAQGRAINETDVVIEVAAQTGLDRDEMAQALGNDSVKALLKSEVDQAVQRGVFGSPFVIVDDEPFWGFDRFDYIEKWLASRQP
jgi:2-hydroxychromene-2-carboxylate isomerase